MSRKLSQVIFYLGISVLLVWSQSSIQSPAAASGSGYFATQFFAQNDSTCSGDVIFEYGYPINVCMKRFLNSTFIVGSQMYTCSEEHGLTTWTFTNENCIQTAETKPSYAPLNQCKGNSKNICSTTRAIQDVQFPSNYDVFYGYAGLNCEKSTLTDYNAAKDGFCFQYGTRSLRFQYPYQLIYPESVSCGGQVNKVIMPNNSNCQVVNQEAYRTYLSSVFVRSSSSSSSSSSSTLPPSPLSSPPSFPPTSSLPPSVPNPSPSAATYTYIETLRYSSNNCNDRSKIMGIISGKSSSVCQSSAQGLSTLTCSSDNKKISIKGYSSKTQCNANANTNVTYTRTQTSPSCTTTSTSTSTNSRLSTLTTCKSTVKPFTSYGSGILLTTSSKLNSCMMLADSWTFIQSGLCIPVTADTSSMTLHFLDVGNHKSYMIGSCNDRDYSIQYYTSANCTGGASLVSSVNLQSCNQMQGLYRGMQCIN